MINMVMKIKLRRILNIITETVLKIVMRIIVKIIFERIVYWYCREDNYHRINFFIFLRHLFFIIVLFCKSHVLY